MCYFAYVSIVMRDAGAASRSSIAHVRPVAQRHGHDLVPLDTQAARALGHFAEGAHLHAALEVVHCACDWGQPRLDAMLALGLDLLAAHDVTRVRLGSWMQRGRGPKAEDVPELRTQTPRELHSPLRRPFAIELARDAGCEPPRHNLAKLAASLR